MKHLFNLILIVFFSINGWSQTSQLSIKQIMQGTKFVGTSPSSVYWGEHGEYLYFNWNPDQASSDSLYRISLADFTPEKVDWDMRKMLPARNGNYNRDKTKKVYAKNGDLYIYNLTSKSEIQITNTLARESSPIYSYNDDKILFKTSSNLFAWDISSGITTQLTDFRKGSERAENQPSEQDAWLEKEEMQLIGTLEQRKQKKEDQKAIREAHQPVRPKTIYIGKQDIGTVHLNANGNYITYSLYASSSNSTNTKVADYVTEWKSVV